jgi:alkaline phosphatase D
MRRREFLRHAGCFVASAGAAGLAACGDDDDGPRVEPGGDGAVPDGGQPDKGAYSFPQGVASGDPRPTSVMLWTRVQAESGKDGPIALGLEVATDEGFTRKVLSTKALMVDSDSDYCVRIVLQELEPDTVYYYRFSAGKDVSRVGRTWSAPERNTDVPIRFAWAACQDYTGGFYGAYRTMINEDEAANEDERLRFVLHVGDFIYETRGDGFQVALDDDLMPVMLEDRDGAPRMVAPFPSGGGMRSETVTFADTLDDYRHLYKTFLTDPDLQAARARWPFVCIWDDHEFTDDCWQTQANYMNDASFDEASQRRRVAASQAWYEYIPAILEGAEEEDGIEPAATNFRGASVMDAEYTDPVEVDEPNNVAALAALTIYRRLRFGQHVDLVLTDSRSYRSDHALLEEASKDSLLVFHPRAGLPLEVVNTLDAGRSALGGAPPDVVQAYENSRKDSPPGSILGPDQKAWLKEVLKASSATFKVWGNSIPLLRLRLDTTDVALFAGQGDLVLSADAWDGYPSERSELMGFIKDNAIRNVVSLSGDHHAHFVGLVHDDHDGAVQTPVMADFATAGISSSSQFAAIANAIEGAIPPGLEAAVAPVLKLIVYDSTPLGGEQKAVVNLNTLLLYGANAATLAAETHDLDAVEAARRPVNEHLRYADSGANGYGLARFDRNGAQITMVTIERPLADVGDDGIGIRGRASFTLPRTDEGEEPTLEAPTLTGTKPFPLRS